jgi:sugar phosphate isomerase/epimerase
MEKKLNTDLVYTEMWYISLLIGEKFLTMKPNVGVSLYSYGADLIRGRMTVNECIDHAAGLGVKGIELVDKHHIPNYPYPSVLDLLELRDYIKSFGCEISCYSTYEDTRSKATEPPSKDEIVKLIGEHVAITNVLGAKVNRPAFFFPTIEEYVEVVHKCLNIFKQFNVKFGIEIHAPLPPQMYLNIIEKLNSEYVGLTPDFSAWQEKGLEGAAMMEPLELFEACMPYTFHVHAKAHVFDEEGVEPYTPYDKLVTILRESGFDGYISAEYEGWYFKDCDSKKIVETHVNLIKKYL